MPREKRSKFVRGPRNKARGKKNVNTYYLPGDATPILREGLLVNQTNAKTYVQDFMMSDVAQVTSSTSVNVYGAKSFKLNDVPQYASWTVLFDKYRILKVELHFVASGVQENAANAQVAPIFATALDFDNDTTPTTFDEVLRRSRSTESVATTSVKRCFVPRVARQVYNGVASVNYEEAAPHIWLDCASAATPHYGAVWAMGTASSTSYLYRVHAKYTVEFGFPIG